MMRTGKPGRAGRRGLQAGLVLLGLAVVAWAALAGGLWAFQERLLFRPVPLAAGTRLSDQPDVAERVVDVPGARLSVLQLRLPDPKGVVFFLHGNNGNLTQWYTDGEPYRRAGFDLVMMDYRGFGKSSGRIESEAQLHADVEAVWQAVAPRYRGRRVVAYGRSLGTGLAAAWAARHQPDLTILVSPYSSMRDLAALHHPWAPGWVLRYALRTDAAVARIRTPLLLLHGDRDTLIPPDHSRVLAAAAAHARVVLVPGAAHADVHRFEAYRSAVDAALAGAARSPGDAASAARTRS